MSKDNAFLADILKAGQAIQRFVAGVSKDDFLANEEKYEAVTRKLEIIGEAARHLSSEARNAFPEVPWPLVCAMRNLLIHDYDGVDLNIVWRTAQEDMPLLIEKIEAYLASQPPP
jgi:uncharacterized protein with HEPN domain